MSTMPVTRLSTMQNSLSMPIVCKGSFFKKNWAIPGHFYIYFVFSTVINKFGHEKILPRAGFELRTSGIGSDLSVNWSTTTSQESVVYFVSDKPHFNTGQTLLIFGFFVLYTTRHGINYLKTRRQTKALSSNEDPAYAKNGLEFFLLQSKGSMTEASFWRDGGSTLVLSYFLVGQKYCMMVT